MKKHITGFFAVIFISFTLPVRSPVSTRVVDTLGSEIVNLISEELPAGSYSKNWNANNFSSGIYYCLLRTNAVSQTKKLILLK